MTAKKPVVHKGVAVTIKPQTLEKVLTAMVLKGYLEKVKK